MQKGLLQISPLAPGWWIGPGQGDINPVGGAIGWLALMVLLLIARRSWGTTTNTAKR